MLARLQKSGIDLTFYHVVFQNRPTGENNEIMYFRVRGIPIPKHFQPNVYIPVFD